MLFSFVNEPHSNEHENGFKPVDSSSNFVQLKLHTIRNWWTWEYGSKWDTLAKKCFFLEFDDHAKKEYSASKS